MNQDIVKLVREKLGYACDNLHRAKSAAQRCDPSKEWVQSGQTLNEIVAGYQQEYDRWVKALADIGETP